ncbi:hypothetical protein ACO34A_27900 (plasmid) [Rhizobium sp. ACO-34A]|nr:2Fe-2S iron-sulfur cluster-binding protein [Rhizobium sp. ACO-34A]ATN37598.1 hypothetical protein ACO34A_27900 [Rhizobium sp. ACO-34A]
MTKIFVTDPAGRETALEAENGELLMKVLRTAGLGIKGSCEGALSCGSCHVHIDPATNDLLEPPAEDEIDMIDLADGAISTSRFSCQIRISPTLDGLRLSIPA